jgi:hypothetical protein
MTVPQTVKPMPEIPGVEFVVCNKCYGTGFWCRGIENGAPFSNTGFDCWQCRTVGWVRKQFERANKDARVPAFTLAYADGNILTAVNANGVLRQPKSEGITRAQVAKEMTEKHYVILSTTENGEQWCLSIENRCILKHGCKFCDYDEREQHCHTLS